MTMEDSSSSSTRRTPIPQFGLSVVVDPSNPRYDIIFVHGLNGHLERTWTAKRAEADDRSDPRGATEHSERPAKFRRLNRFWKGSEKKPVPSEVNIFWPRDLVSKVIPDARVLTYGYDAKIRPPTGPPASRLSIYQIANDFLIDLEAERRDGPDRPIIFVAHSLGGIVVQEVLRRSSSATSAHLRSVFESTFGIIFFGTPHYGANPRESLRRFAMAVAKAMNYSFNEQLINSLLPSSERLQELRDTFGPISQNRQWIIYSFQEQYGVQSLGGDKVVEDESSRLNIPELETVEHIGRDHHRMCRFTDLGDPEFKKVNAALSRIIKSVSDKQGKVGRHSGPSLSDDQRNNLLESLEFEQIDARHMTIRNAHAKTCRWLIRTSEFRAWLDDKQFNSHRGFIWMKGNPGTGKSTMMKFVLGHAKRNFKDKAIISFFFNARGEELEKSTLGLYRSLLFQILTQLPELKTVFDSLGLLSATRNGVNHRWAVEPLKELLREAIWSLREKPVLCFIDALDECDETEIRDMISFFQDISGPETDKPQLHFSVFFSSRHYPHITIDFGLTLCLERQNGHDQDITNYLATELRIGNTTLANEIREELQKKAFGIFIWVVLVVGILNKEHDKGNMHTLRKRLRDIPRDLYKLFREIIQRDDDNSAQVLLCIQWVLFARRPLTVEELFFAVRSGLGSDVMTEWDPEESSKESFERFLLDSSKGLAELTRSTKPKVQFIHESVRDFLFKENELGTIWPELKGRFEGTAHETLKNCCLSYNRVDVSAFVDLGKPLKKASDASSKDLRQSLMTKFPLLEYSVQNLFSHANKAEKNNIEQSEFLNTLDRKRWIAQNNVLEIHEARRYTPSATLLYILAEANASYLIENHFSNIPCFELEQDERYGSPLVAATATRSIDALHVFYKHLSAKHKTKVPTMEELSKVVAFSVSRSFTFNKNRSMVSQLAEAGDLNLITIYPDIDKKEFDLPEKDTGKTPLCRAAERGQDEVVNFLIRHAGANPNWRDKHGRTPLLLASTNGHAKVFMGLLENKKVDPDAKDKDNRTPLSYASQYSKEAVRILLETGRVDPDTKDKDNRTPLSYASAYGREAIIRLLLETGRVNPDAKDKDNRTPLSYASQYSKEAVRILLETGRVNPDTKDKDNRTPLSYASAYGREAIVRLLLETGRVNPDAKDKDNRTPLSYASQYSKEAVRILLETGRVDPDTKDKDNRTPLSYASASRFSGKEDTVRLLLETGKVNPSAKDDNIQTPLSYARYRPVIRGLLEAGKVDPDVKD